MTVFLTFGDSTYERSLRRIEREAATSGFFDKFRIKRPADLGPAFWRRHGKLVAANRRGFGCWVWKPWIILEELRAAEPGEIVVYLDAGCTINARGWVRFDEYCRLAKASPVGVLGFQLPLLEKSYTKGEVFEQLAAWHLKETRQVLAGVVVLHNRPESIQFVEEWQSLVEDHRLISEAPSSVADDPAFKCHRHDQSVFSLLSKLRGAALLDDETYFDDWSDAAKMPFWATRLRGDRPGRLGLLRRDLALRWRLTWLRFRIGRVVWPRRQRSR